MWDFNFNFNFKRAFDVENFVFKERVTKKFYEGKLS